MGKVPDSQFHKTNTILWNQFGSQRPQNIHFIWPNNSTAKDLSEWCILEEKVLLIWLKHGKGFLFLPRRMLFGILAGGWSGRSEDPEIRPSESTRWPLEHQEHSPPIAFHAAHRVWVTLPPYGSINTWAWWEHRKRVSHELECKMVCKLKVLPDYI